ncbi:MAG TPA: hypothetical protein VEN12_09265 [Verrucomicrobiae bacterium]|nr:hypothetical protein [Verrucomicrobiae bacterium]
MRHLIGTPGAVAGWGIAFAVLLLVSAAMVSLPTSAQSGERIAAFYIAHGELIVLQQIVGVAALGAFIAFALSLRPSRWLRPALWLFAVTELATNVIPLVMEASNPRADTAHMLTVAEDIADSALFIAIAVFVAAATMTQPVWLRVAAYVVAAACTVRALGSPLGFTALDVVAPLAFVAFVIVLSVKSLVRRQSAAVLS